MCVGKCGSDQTNHWSTYLVDIHLLSSTLQLNCILKVLVLLVKSCCGIYGFGVFVFVPMGLKLLSIPAIYDVKDNLNWSGKEISEWLMICHDQKKTYDIISSGVQKNNNWRIKNLCSLDYKYDSILNIYYN